MRSIFQQISRLVRRSPLPPLVFSNSRFQRLSPDLKIEEETFPDYLAARYYPVRIGEVFVSRYQVVGKLGYGAFSTVWLARDLNQHRHVALKVFIYSQAMGNKADHELAIYNHLATISSKSRHRFCNAVRTLLDSFKVTGPDGVHHCLVHPPLWDSVDVFLARNPVRRLPIPVLGVVLHYVFLALDFLHTECNLIHTDLKADNIMMGAADDTALEDFEREELENPSPRKEVDGRFIYVSRQLNPPKNYTPPVLCDFGSAVSSEKENTTVVQPEVYRSPEVTLGIPWDSKIDIWNVGCMVKMTLNIWNIFEGGNMFSGRDPEHKAYRARAHLASMISLLGPPPPELIKRRSLSARFFSEEGKFNTGIPLPPARSFEEMETNLQGTEKELFIQFVRKMMQWAPENRSTAKELLKDPWLRAHI
ncbi:hypothetical protein PRK78_000773 [Emydomyces testavorans]|uniref:non-specific serine/threonine protein kinase n=1 Tax=Emydomyces testavorans TaxID=2070801 RepID=A0AAF0DBB4_9EURO|nr:hypothetical protein PRK78_000773 [Emydomyces testavorans]